MAASVAGVFENSLRDKILSTKLLVVGAGGIGCELLKNLVLTGFLDITLIDLDTIDVSNLNRQFLFQKVHVGKSKAKVAKESALRFNPDAKITAYHDSITSSVYGVDFFKKFNVVLNALDNRVARNHVNRMCLAAAVPLVESGTAGYLGQVTVIKKAVTECYECQPKPGQKTFPGCTIRNTPSDPIHCIVWSKHLFNQLFGEEDPDEDVSPDTADPEASAVAGSNALSSEVTDKGNVVRTSTRLWAKNCKYNPEKLFHKLFHDDIYYLLSMDKLWLKRRPPVPLNWKKINDEDVNDIVKKHRGISDQRIWSLKECVNNFTSSVNSLKTRLDELGADDHLVWDKDDDRSMDFVTACANIRAHIFGISQKCRFDVKSMAGNIIPAIATTNAVISGLIVMETLKILQGRLNACKTVYLKRQPNYRKKLLVQCDLDKPNPKCYVCSEKPEVTLRLNTEKTTVKSLEEKVLKSQLNMAAPDVEIIDGKGTILISSEEGETEDNYDKFLSDFGIRNGSVLKCDDFLQVLVLNVNILHCDECEDGKEFELIGDLNEIKAKSEEAANAVPVDGTASSSQRNETAASDVIEVDDELIIVETEDDDVAKGQTLKRKREDDGGGDSPVKKKIFKRTAEVSENDRPIVS